MICINPHARSTVRMPLAGGGRTLLNVTHFCRDDFVWRVKRRLSMTLKRRDLLLSGSGMAAAAAVSQFTAIEIASAQAPRAPTEVATYRGCRRHRLGRDRPPGRHRRTRGRRLGHPGRSRKGYRRSRHHQRRQCSARRRYQRAEEIRHQRFSRSAVPRSDRLVSGRAERFSRLSLQRSRDHSRLCRQQRADLRMAGRARRHLRRQGARRIRRHFGRQFGAAGNAQRGHGLADGADRQAGRSDDPEDAIVRQWTDAPA